MRPRFHKAVESNVGPPVQEHEAIFVVLAAPRGTAADAQPGASTYAPKSMDAESSRKSAAWAAENAELLEAMRARIRAKIQRDLTHENEAAEALRRGVRARIDEAIRAYRACGNAGRIWLFGSFAWGKPGPRSDIDIFVESGIDEDAFAAKLSDLCGREVHVVAAGSAAPGLRERVEREGILL